MEYKTQLASLIRAKEYEYDKLSKKYDTAKIKRFVCVALVYSLAALQIMSLFGIEASFTEVMGAILASIFIGGLTALLSAVIFNQLFQKAEQEKKHLENLKKEIEQLKERLHW